MAKATLPSIPWIRTMDNEVIGDILYYFSTFHGRRMLEMVINKLNDAYDRFMAAHPNFTGSTSLVAHSLGGMVCYEILHYMNMLEGNQGEASKADGWEEARYRNLPRLGFIPDRLFTMGSPIGGTMVFRNLSMTDYHMGPVGYHNIFHPFDPFGYRTEPLFDDYYADVAAVPITVSRHNNDQQSDGHQQQQPAGGLWKRTGEHSLHGWSRHLSLTESMTDLGKNVLDAVALAPVTLLGAVRWAAKSSVSTPLGSVASRVGMRRRESLDMGRPTKDTSESVHMRRRTFFGMSATHDGENRSDVHGRQHSRRRSFSRLLPSFRSFSFGGTTRNSDADGQSPVEQPAEDAVAGDNEDKRNDGVRNKHGSSPSTLSFLSLAVSSRMAAASADSSSSGSDSEPSHVPLDNAARQQLQRHPLRRIDASDSANGASAVTVPIVTKDTVEQQHISKGRLGKVEDIATDDMFGQLMRIFGPSRPPNREQQMAESQGLPLSSKLLATRNMSRTEVTRGGASIRVTNTVPLDGSGLAATCAEVKESAATQTSAVPVCAVNVRSPSGIWIRRANSMPHSHEMPVDSAQQTHTENMLLKENDSRLYLRPGDVTPRPPRRSTSAPAPSPTPIMPRSSSAADVTSAHVDERPENAGNMEELQENDGMDDTIECHPLPYAERMDYIIPFTKRHLQNDENLKQKPTNRSMAVLRQEDDVETTQKPTHLMILVPGTGPQREDERPKNSFISRAKKFRQWVQEFCSREFADSGANVHVLTIDYHSDIHEHESAKQ
ncbi:hypothetical protein FB645_001689 [Coemansia sp. IMI 203386]|nr:hypothetical protein FB645_001689 [Coemansia sp. IMI 203386]